MRHLWERLDAYMQEHGALLWFTAVVLALIWWLCAIGFVSIGGPEVEALR